MRVFKNSLLTVLAAISCSTTTAYAQAIRSDLVERFDAVDTVQFVGGDWNPGDDAVVFRLSASDGETRDISFALPESGRTLMRVHTTCPAFPPDSGLRGAGELAARCGFAQGIFYGMDLAKFDRWELRLQNIPAGEHSVKLAVFPQVE